MIPRVLIAIVAALSAVPASAADGKFKLVASYQASWDAKDYKISLFWPADWPVGGDPGDYTRVEIEGKGAQKLVLDGLTGVKRGEVLSKASSSLDSPYLTLFAGPKGRSVLFIEEWAFASDPGELIAVGLDAAGVPRVLFRRNFRPLKVLREDGAVTLVGRPSFSQGFTDDFTTYDPLAVYRWRLGDADGFEKSDADSRRETEASGLPWAGPNASEDIIVYRGEKPARIVTKDEMERLQRARAKAAHKL